MNVSIGPNQTAVTGVDPAERTQALADARRRASQSALANAEAAEARRADSFENARDILSRALGANTRLAIARQDESLTFVYRAIDVDTGEIVREWPPADFARFLETNGELLDRPGVVVDENV